MATKIHLALIYGSTREGRFCDTVAKWAADEIEKQGDFSIDVIDPALLDLPVRHEAQDGAQVIALKTRIGRSDAFVIVTPEYNYGYPASLKFLIDSVVDEWQAKPVAFVSYGGISGGLRAIEQLRLVFAELHAVGIRDSVSFANPWDLFDADGALLDPTPAGQSASVMLERLHWWATALRNARDATSYLKAAA